MTTTRTAPALAAGILLLGTLLTSCAASSDDTAADTCSATLAEVTKPAQTNYYDGLLESDPTALTGPWDLVRIVDGDTIVVSAKGCEDTTVDLLGVDIEHVDRAAQDGDASLALGRMLDSTVIWLEHDPDHDTRDDGDDEAAYVWISAAPLSGESQTGPDQLVNYSMVELGLVSADDVDHRYATQFSTAEETARTHGVGMWH